jgi:hypothetical protein
MGFTTGLTIHDLVLHLWGRTNYAPLNSLLGLVVVAVLFEFLCFCSSF